MLSWRLKVVDYPSTGRRMVAQTHFCNGSGNRLRADNHRHVEGGKGQEEDGISDIIRPKDY